MFPEAIFKCAVCIITRYVSAECFKCVSRSLWYFGELALRHLLPPQRVSEYFILFLLQHSDYCADSGSPCSIGTAFQALMGPWLQNCPNELSKKNRGMPATTNMTV